MKMSSIRAIKDGNVVCICQCLFVMKAKPNKFYILFYFNLKIINAIFHGQIYKFQ